MSRSTAQKFQLEIMKVVEYFKTEYDLALGEAVGVLELIKFDLIHDNPNDYSDLEDE